MKYLAGHMNITVSDLSGWTEASDADSRGAQTPAREHIKRECGTAVGQAVYGALFEGRPYVP